jgi:hypothetical protein
MERRRKMRNHVKVLAVTIVAIACLGLGCFGSMPRPGYFENMERTAGEGKSEIVVKRLSRFTGCAVAMTILIDGKERLRLWSGGRGTVIVPNGRYSICASHPLSGFESNVIAVDATSSRIVIEAKYTMFSGIQLSKYMEIPFDSSDSAPSNDNYNTYQPKPVVASSDQELPKIAVYVTGNIGEDEKKALGTRMLASLVNSGRYKGIERSNAFLAEIDREMTKQRSGAIDDGQISELGRQFGVKFVCVADITPAFGDYQVSARIVNVETAEVVFIGESSGKLESMADLSRISDQVVQNMFDGQKMPVRRYR